MMVALEYIYLSSCVMWDPCRQISGATNIMGIKFQGPLQCPPLPTKK